MHILVSGITLAALCDNHAVYHLKLDRLYGNYFMAVGSYFLIGGAAAMQSNRVWSDARVGENA